MNLKRRDVLKPASLPSANLSRAPGPVRAGSSDAAARRRMAAATVSGLLIAVLGAGVVFAGLLDFAGLWLPFGRGMWLLLAVLAFPAGCLLLLRRGRVQVASVAIAVAAIFVIQMVPWNARKRFLLDLTDLDRGMSVVEVEEAMQGWGYGFGADYTVRPADWPVGEACTTYTGSLCFRWTGGPTSDWGSVHFRDGRVVRVAWSPD